MAATEAEQFLRYFPEIGFGGLYLQYICQEITYSSGFHKFLHKLRTSHLQRNPLPGQCIVRYINADALSYGTLSRHGIENAAQFRIAPAVFGHYAECLIIGCHSPGFSF